MKKKLIVLSGFGAVFAPLLAFAQTPTANITTCAQATGSGIEAFLCKIQSIMNIVIPILVVLGVLYFVWGVVQYVIASDEEAKKSGRNRIIYGIIGLVVIVAMWGLVRIVTNTFGLNNSNAGYVTPGVPLPGAQGI